MENRHGEIVRSILNKYPYHFYAYGSRVKGQAKKYSDLDICGQEEIPGSVLSNIGGDLEESDLPFKVDLVAGNGMDKSFQELIKPNLILIS